MNVSIYFDGACHNQVGKSSPMGIGVAVLFNREYQEDISRAIFDAGDKVRGTNNIAEWIGCVEAMKVAADIRKVYPNAEIIVFSDSQIITNQFNGSYTINNQAFLPYFKEARLYADKANLRAVQWISRERNTKADELSKIALHGRNPESKHYDRYKEHFVDHYVFRDGDLQTARKRIQ